MFVGEWSGRSVVLDGARLWFGGEREVRGWQGLGGEDAEELGFKDAEAARVLRRLENAVPFAIGLVGSTRAQMQVAVALRLPADSLGWASMADGRLDRFRRVDGRCGSEGLGWGWSLGEGLAVASSVGAEVVRFDGVHSRLRRFARVDGVRRCRGCHRRAASVRRARSVRWAIAA